MVVVVVPIIQKTTKKNPNQNRLENEIPDVLRFLLPPREIRKVRARDDPGGALKITITIIPAYVTRTMIIIIIIRKPSDIILFWYDARFSKIDNEQK